LGVARVFCLRFIAAGGFRLVWKKKERKLEGKLFLFCLI